MPGLEDLIEHYVSEENLDEKCDGWLKTISPYCWRQREPILLDNIGLLVVDMNKPFVDAGNPLSSPNARAILSRINTLVEGFRAARAPIIWIVQGHFSVDHDRGKHLSAWWPNPLLEGTEDVKLATGLTRHSNEKLIVKRRYSAFYQTDLEVTLRTLEISQVVVCGVLTNICPYTTCFDAFYRDFCVYYPADATASLNEDLHLGGLRNIAGWCGYVTRTREILEEMK